MVAIESSTREVSLVAWRGGEVLFEDSFSSDRRHNARIFGPLAELIACLEGLVLERVLVGTGPGSYGGTRVGISAAQGMAIARACPVVGLCSLLATEEARRGGPGMAVGDARRGDWWWARVDCGRLVVEPELCGPEELGRQVATALAAGEPVVTLDPLERFTLPPEQARELVAGRPSARGLIGAWADLTDKEKQGLERIPAEPMYLRPPHITEAKKGHPLLRGGR